MLVPESCDRRQPQRVRELNNVSRCRRCFDVPVLGFTRSRSETSRLKVLKVAVVRNCASRIPQICLEVQVLVLQEGIPSRYQAEPEPLSAFLHELRSAVAELFPGVAVQVKVRCDLECRTEILGRSARAENQEQGSAAAMCLHRRSEVINDFLADTQHIET